MSCVSRARRPALHLAIGVGDLDRIDIRSLIEPGNQGSRPRSSVTIATTRDEDGRQHGDEAEQADDPHVQAGAGRPRRAAARIRRLVCHATMPSERQDQEAVEHEDRQDDLVRRDDRGQRRRERGTWRAPRPERRCTAAVPNQPGPLRLRLGRGRGRCCDGAIVQDKPRDRVAAHPIGAMSTAVMHHHNTVVKLIQRR